MMLHKVSFWGSLCLAVLLSAKPLAAEEYVFEDGQPDAALLEFLGTIAGLENMGVDIDYLLGGLEKTETPLRDEDEHYE